MRTREITQNNSINIEGQARAIDQQALPDGDFEFDFKLNNPIENFVNAATSRVAGRISASLISDEEHNALLKERQQILDKKFAGQISRSEENRLAYVRWSLDRIEDAKYGATLDALESHIEQYENLARQIEALQEKLEEYYSGRRK